MVPIEQLDPNPDQPRQAMGDLSELMASIAEKGIIEPLIVRQRVDRFQIVAGERRYQAATQVGLHEVPVIIRDVDDGEVVEIALIENIQRKDLTPFEEAEAVQALGDSFHYTHEELARRLGKSRTSITESLSLNAMPPDVRSLCKLAEITSKSILLQIARQPDEKSMVALVERITRDGGITRAEARKVAPSRPAVRGRRKPYVFSYVAPTKAYKLKLDFRKSRVDKKELISALEEIIKKLRSG
jgi:ParB family chromosome partitioning protein